MKRTAYMIAAFAALLLMALVPGNAQKTSATVNIPFAFTVDDVRMPAGEYLITSPSEKSAARTTGPAKLVFHKYDNAYFVAAAWMPNSDHAQEFFTSASEIEVARTTHKQTYKLAMDVKK